MIFNLSDVSHITVAGLELVLHFRDTSSHLREFDSLDEMITEIKGWHDRGEALDHQRETALANVDHPC